MHSGFCCVYVCVIGNQVNIAGTMMGSTIQSLTPSTDKKFFSSPKLQTGSYSMGTTGACLAWRWSIWGV